MRATSDTFWVVPFLDDVAEFLSEHGMPESSSIVADAAAKVQRCSLTEAGSLPEDRVATGPSSSANVVTFPCRSISHR